MGLGGRDRVSRTVMFPCVRGSDIVWGWALAPVVKLRDEVVHVPWRTWSQESVNQLVPEPRRWAQMAGQPGAGAPTPVCQALTWLASSDSFFFPCVSWNKWATEKIIKVKMGSCWPCVLGCSVVSNSSWPPDSSVHKIFFRVAISSSRGSSWPRDWNSISCLSCTVGRFFIVESLGKLYVNAILNSRTSWKNMAKDKSQWHSNQPLVNQPACLLRVEWARYHNPQMVLPVRFFRECFQTFVRSQKPTFSLGLMLQAFNKGFGI